MGFGLATNDLVESGVHALLETNPENSSTCSTAKKTRSTLEDSENMDKYSRNRCAYLVLKYISDSLMRIRLCNVPLNYVEQILLHGGTYVGTQIAWEA